MNIDSSNDNSARSISKPSPEVDAPKEDNMISDTLTMGSSNDDSVQFTSKSSSETDDTKTNTAVSVDDATCKRVQDDEKKSLVSKQNQNSSDKGSSEAVTSETSPRSRVVVFDIDNTLCYSRYLGEEKLKVIRKSFPECPIIIWYEDCRYSTTPTEHSHVFLPHLKILFDYLLKQGVRIVFFSSATEKRNQTVIPELLTSFWGSEKFEALKAKGQFDIFSEKHMRKRCFRGEGNGVKDLKVVIRDGETLSDAILVEDDPSFCAHDQKPCFYVIDLMFWYVTDKDKIKIDRSGKSSNFRVNNIYYMLGVFKTYFENEKYKALPLREGLDQLLPEDVRGDADFYERNSFADDMINLGLSEVQKLVPDAMYY